jgi:pseudouridine-5'-monophosphatase
MKKNWNFPKAILFDLDGVLIDSEPLHGQAWKETASHFDVNLTDNQLKLLRGKRRIDCANELIKLMPKAVDATDLLNLHKPISRQLILTAKAMQGGESLVKRCHRNNIPMALVTSSSSESFKIKTARHNWINLFSVIVLGDDKLLVKGKPAPDPYLLAAEKLNVSTQECWAVEDSIAGISSALEAGCFVFFLKDKPDQIKKEEVFVQQNNLKQINYLKEIEKLLK